MALTVSPGSAECRKALQLVVASAATADVAFSEESDVPAVVTPHGESAKGLHPVARYLAEAAGAETSKSLLGSTFEEQALVSPAPAQRPPRTRHHFPAARLILGNPSAIAWPEVVVSASLCLACRFLRPFLTDNTLGPLMLFTSRRQQVSQWITFCNNELSELTDDKLFKVEASARLSFPAAPLPPGCRLRVSCSSAAQQPPSHPHLRGTRPHHPGRPARLQQSKLCGGEPPLRPQQLSSF